MESGLKASDVITKREGVFRYDGATKLTRSGAGVAVRAVEVRLGPGEQFDLEATCLPKQETLADCFAVIVTIGAQFLAAKDPGDFCEDLRSSLGEDDDGGEAFRAIAKFLLRLDVVGPRCGVHKGGAILISVSPALTPFSGVRIKSNQH